MKWLLALLVVAGCTTRSPKAPVPDDRPAAIAIKPQSTVIRTGQVGVGQREIVTYTYVDVENPSKIDRLVTLEGALLDDHGASLAPLPADELRIPAGATRTFALVATKAVPAASASFRVANAVAVDYPPQVALSDEEFTPGPVPVATAKIKNTLDRDVSAVAATTFYDAAGTILARPFTVVLINAGRTRQLRFEGPPAAVRAQTFAGQVAFH